MEELDGARGHALVVAFVAAEQIESPGVVEHVELGDGDARILAQRGREGRASRVGLHGVAEDLVEEDGGAALGEHDVGLAVAGRHRPVPGRGGGHEEGLELVGRALGVGRVKRDRPLLVSVARRGGERALDRDQPPPRDGRRRRRREPRGDHPPLGLAHTPEETVPRSVAAEDPRQSSGPALKVGPGGSLVSGVALLGLAGLRSARIPDGQRLAPRNRPQRTHGLADRRLIRAGHEGETLVAAEAPARGDAFFAAHPHVAEAAVRPRDGDLASPLAEDLGQLPAPGGERLQPPRHGRVVPLHGPQSIEACNNIAPGNMSLADVKKDFVAGRAARGIAGRKLFAEKAPGALRGAVYAALEGEAEKEHTLDEEARRMMEAARQEIASGRVDGHELFRRIRRKLAEQRGIVL